MKKISNIALILTIFLCVFFFLSICSYASIADSYLGGALGGYGASGYGEGVANNVTGAIISGLKVLGVSVGIIVILWLAIKYMTSAPEGKADIVKTAVPFLIGALVFFGAGTILDWISRMI